MMNQQPAFALMLEHQRKAFRSVLGVFSDCQLVKQIKQTLPFDTTIYQIEFSYELAPVKGQYIVVATVDNGRNCIPKCSSTLLDIDYGDDICKLMACYNPSLEYVHEYALTMQRENDILLEYLRTGVEPKVQTTAEYYADCVAESTDMNADDREMWTGLLSFLNL